MKVTSLFKTQLLPLIGACALILAASTGCNKDKKSEVAVAASGEAPAGSASGAAPSGPCETYAAKVCAKVGDTNAACKTLKEASELMSPATCEAASTDIEVTFKKVADQRSSCEELVTALCSEIGKETETCKMVTEQTKQFPPAQCKQMLTNKDKIVVELKQREAANQPLTAELQAKIAASDAPSFGPADAKVTLVEFSDFECPYCVRAASVVTDIKKNYADKVRFVFRQFPLGFHKDAHGAAQAALAANAEGKFWEFHDKLFANQKAIDTASLEKYAKELGLKKVTSALSDKTYAAQVDADMKLGAEVGVQGTPTLFINGKRVANPTDFAAVKTEIDALLK
jgi:protein-disulfide isomerase